MATIAPSTFAPGLEPAAPFIKFGEGGTPYLEGYRCSHCAAAYVEERMACAQCGARGGFATFRIAETGRVYTFTVVSRSYPGIKVPFVSAIVDMDDGVVLKGNIIDIEPDPTRIPFGLPVRLVFGDANGQATPDGRAYISYFFSPIANGAAA